MSVLATPGVYIKEIDGLSLSVSSSLTAVPVFAVGPADKEPWWKVVGKPLRINSFSEYEKYETSSELPVAKKNARDSQINTVVNGILPRRKADSWRWATFSSLAASGVRAEGEGGIEWDRRFAPALRAYFENGGGYCYVCPHDKLAEFVPGMADVTLVVQAGQEAATGAIQQVCIPGSMKFGLLDGPRTLEELGNFPMSSSDCTAIYFPWLKADWRVNDKNGAPIDKDKIHLVAPSAVVAGIMCTVDRERGVWKAPANVAVRGGLRPAIKVGNITQDKYTQPGSIAVNMIREFEGRGTQVWGARTMTVSGNSWLYIPVRRLFDMAERDIKATLQAVVFEPNGPATWEVVRSSVDNYLFNLWKRGAFSGSSPQTSYFVRVGAGVTMSQQDIDAGILRVSVGLAAVRPAEYIELEFTQQVASGA
ncbi:hypothetical protein SME10J_46870 [Serratia marcescens]|nr:hypothetical protein SME10J_23880 [Serratia marcescens]BEM40960.1 hypothetical protein SME10J_46870 [Serratia marcescens]